MAERFVVSWHGDREPTRPKRKTVRSGNCTASATCFTGTLSATLTWLRIRYHSRIMSWISSITVLFPAHIRVGKLSCLQNALRILIIRVYSRLHAVNCALVNDEQTVFRNLNPKSV